MRDSGSKKEYLNRSWNRQLNPGESLEGLSLGSRKRLIWKCLDCNYVYQRSIHSQVKQLGICPRCSYLEKNKERNLKITHPDIAKSLVDELNEGWLAEHLTHASHRKLFWRCPHCQKVFDASVVQRLKSNRCGFCTGKRVSTTNSLKALNPSVAHEWDYEKNKGLTPSDVTANSSREVWFTCKECKHSWLARCNSRTHARSGCPECAKKQVKEHLKKRHREPKEMNIRQTHPWLVEQWHLVLNGDLVPESIREKSNRWIWWNCVDCGHTWKQQVIKRTSTLKWRDCPCCSKRSEVVKQDEI